MKVNTVLGPVDTKDLGVTLMHEHIANVDWNFAHAFAHKGFYDREGTVKMFVEEMKPLKELYGLKTFVDASAITLGRDIELLRRCSEEAEINVVACTGLYWQEDPYYCDGVNPDYLAELLIDECENGIEGSSSKPGYLKCSSSVKGGETKVNENMIRGVARAAKATGLPIYTHSDPRGGGTGLWQKRILEDEGVDMAHVAYGHAGSCGDQAYETALMEGGSYVGFDQVGFFLPTNAPKSYEALEAFIKDDEKRRHIFLSCDQAVRSDYGMVLSGIVRDKQKNICVYEEMRRKALFEGILGMLREKGVTQRQIDEVMQINPRRFFGENI